MSEFSIHDTMHTSHIIMYVKINNELRVNVILNYCNSARHAVISITIQLQMRTI